MIKFVSILVFIFIIKLNTFGQLATQSDSLRGTINSNRSWWDVTYYELDVTPNLETKEIQGNCSITFKVLNSGTIMQIDLQKPLVVTGVLFDTDLLSFVQKDNICLISFKNTLPIASTQKIRIDYYGKPKEAKNAPWDGGIVWKKDKENRPFVNTACQGLGASVWWPCKDHQSDEPDSMKMHFTVDSNLVAVGNGKLRNKTSHNNGKTTYTWAVTQPINNYNVTMNIANYKNFSDTLNGEKGILNMDYWVLDYNLEKAKKHFLQAKQTVRALEYWFGAYPFYEDSYKLVETHHLGMEHQSAVAYGNKYQNGYLGNDLSGSGWGLKWDFIIVHESGHEWFGNNITTKDIADMWVHEGFTNYSETLFTQYHYGTEAGNEYVQGLRKNISNDIPIIGNYGINQEGSGDMYYKGANCIHTIRTLINNDVLFRNILRGLNKEFYHKTITTQDVENYISKNANIDFSKVFDQYLRTTQIPKVNYQLKKQKSKWIYELTLTDVVNDFKIKIPIKKEVCKLQSIILTDKKSTKVDVKPGTKIEDIISKNLYFIVAKK
jgi:aminopeptidase N